MFLPVCLGRTSLGSVGDWLCASRDFGSTVEEKESRRNSKLDEVTRRLVARSVSLETLLLVYNIAVRSKNIDSDSTTGELVEGLLKPVTAGTETSFVEFLEKKAHYRPEPAASFVIHSWGGKVRDLMMSAAVAANSGGPQPTSSDSLLDTEWHRTVRPQNLKVRFWVCAFVVNQHLAGRSLFGNTPCELDKFAKVCLEVTSRSKKPIVMILDADNLVLRRTSCLEELYFAIKGGYPLEVHGMKVAESDVNVAKAESNVPELQDCLNRRLQGIEGGLEAVNLVINRYLAKLQTKSQELAIPAAKRKSTTIVEKKKQTMAAKLAGVGHENDADEEDAGSLADGEWKVLEGHKRERVKDDEARELLKAALRNDRASALLRETEIAEIVEVMEYFEFTRGETVIAQGTIGNTFFVAHSGSLEVSVNAKVCNTVSKGMAFGGRAMLYKCPRTATIKATEDSGVWGVSGDMLHKVIQENSQRSYEENRRFLGSIHLFSGLPQRQLDRMGEALFTEVFQDGSRVVTEGESATALYFVKEGELAMCQGGTVQADGKLVGGTEISRLKPSDCCGEKPLVTGKPWPYTLMAVGRCEVLCISLKELQKSEGSSMQSFLGSRLYVAVRMSLQRHKLTDGMTKHLYKGAGDALSAAAELDRQMFSMQLQREGPTTLIAHADFTDRTSRGVAWVKLKFLERSGLLQRSIEEKLGPLRALAPALEGRSFQAEILDLGDRLDDSIMEEAGHSELGACLERSFLLLSLKRSAFFGQLSADQCMKVVQQMTMKDFAGGDSLNGEDLHAVVVLEGELTFLDPSGSRSKLSRGQLCEAEVLGKAQSAVSICPDGARLGLLERSKLNGVLSKDLLPQAGGEEAADFARKMVLIKKVHIFRHLSQEQTSRLASAFVITKMARGEFVMRQGDDATSLYVIAQGEVQVLIGNKVIRTMARNAYFGERALIFDEKRTATIEVTSQEAELWSLEKSTFLQILNDKMKKALDARIRLQDTSVTLKDVQQVKVIGTGAAGVVRLVQHKTTNTRYALKRVVKKKGAIPADVERECALLAESDHPMIMALVKTFETEKSVYILTELITGGELYSAIRTIPIALSRTQAQFYTGSLVIVLEELSDRGIVFRDLKPENVMLDSQGYLKLIDFGIAKKLGEENKTFTTIGTPHYMAPEVMRGRGYGTEVDLWSLGVMLFEFVCGYLPFADDADEPTEVCTAVIKAPLSFPAGYRDRRGRALIQSLLCRPTSRRIGCGLRGFDDIKEHEFFKAGSATSSIFDRIMGRELDPPIVPGGEVYSDDPAVKSATDDLSDAGELG